MARHRSIVYAIAYVAFASGVLTAMSLVVTKSVGFGFEQSASALLALGVLGTIVLQPWQRIGSTAGGGVRPPVGASSFVSTDDVLDFGVVCVGLVLWSALALALV